MRNDSIYIADIEIGDRHRAVSEDAVHRLAASMKDIGLRQPITVRIVEEMIIDGRPTVGVPVLVAGRHRLAAANALGWSHIDCLIVEDDAIACELWEIAENLHRLDLTKEQRDGHIRRYAELLEAKAAAQIQVRQNDAPEIGYGKPPPQTKGVASQVAAETGLSVRTVQRALNPPPPRPAPPIAHEPTGGDRDAAALRASVTEAAKQGLAPERKDRRNKEFVNDPAFQMLMRIVGPCSTIVEQVGRGEIVTAEALQGFLADVPGHRERSLRFVAHARDYLNAFLEAAQ